MALVKHHGHADGCIFCAVCFRVHVLPTTEHIMEIVTLATAFSNRKRALARGLIGQLKCLARGVLKCTHIVVTAIKSNRNIKAFWTKMGFQQGGLCLFASTAIILDAKYFRTPRHCSDDRGENPKVR